MARSIRIDLGDKRNSTQRGVVHPDRARVDRAARLRALKIHAATLPKTVTNTCRVASRGVAPIHLLRGVVPVVIDMSLNHTR